MRSLFILSLPRSLSSMLYDQARNALGLQAPDWVSDGEVLNADRHSPCAVERRYTGQRFVTERAHPQEFAGALASLDAVTHPQGHIYKDVVNPFVVARWDGLDKYNVLRIRRDVADVGYAMMNRGWDYPKAALESRSPMRSPEQLQIDLIAIMPWFTKRRWLRRMVGGYPLNQVLAGLVLAEAVLARLPGEVIAFDACVRDSHPLVDALRRLYPEVDVGNCDYVDEAFRKHRDEITARRQTAIYREIQRRVGALRRMDSAGLMASCAGTKPLGRSDRPL